jgi:cytidyltransferase-like protein
MVADIKNKQIVVAVSGGFDPIYVGHIRLLQAAKKLGDKLVVILNNDNWLKKKKGYVFIASTRTERNFRGI